MAESGSSGRAWRWSEVDRWGHSVYCAEDTWQLKCAKHPELVENEDAIRTTIRNPDALFLDEEALAQRQRAASAVAVVHYVSQGRARGEPEGNFVLVVARWEHDLATDAIVGYVHTAFLPDAIRSRLELLWERHR